MCCPLSRVGVSDRIVAKGVWDGSAFQETGRVALSFTRPRHIQGTTQIGLRSRGCGRCHGGRGLLVVFADEFGDDLCVPGVLVERGDLVQSGYERLGHGSIGAEHRLIHR
jgi:hypothetical protein